jgi:putative zinc finger protein
MWCKEVVAKTTDYFEGALSETEAREWESHAGHCADCIRYIFQLRLTIDLLAGLRSSPVEEVWPRILH